MAFVTIFTSCDKIEESEYVIYSGAIGEWFTGNGVADKTQRAIIEKYTGVRCTNCPTADDAINTALGQYGGKLIAVAIHDSSFAFTRPIGDSPDLRTPDGDAWSKYYGIAAAGQYPAGLVSRTRNGNNWDLFTPTSGINSHVDPIVNSETKIAVQVDAALDNDIVKTTVNVEFLKSINGEVVLTLLIMEDGIQATQRMPDGSDNTDYIHNHVLRDVITDVWGADVDCKGAAGEKLMAVFDYDQANEAWDLSKCHIVAIISDKASRQVINVAECDIK